ncbi:MAG: hypothetical protein II359_05285 [Clostridia bacterium]|nr:hypothetical protein [Clostridia bacterium]
MKRVFALFLVAMLMISLLVPVAAQGMKIGTLGNETVNLVGNTTFLTGKDAFWYSENGQIFCDETKVAEGDATCLNLIGDVLYFIDADASVKKLENGEVSVLYSGEELSCFYASSMGKGWFLQNGVIFSIQLATGETSVCKALGENIKAFIPTEYGFVYSVGEWADYKVYLEENLLKTGVFSFYREGDYLVFSCDGEEDSQIAFADIVRGKESFEEVSLYGSDVDVRELLAAIDTTTDLVANDTAYGEVTEDAIYEAPMGASVRTLSAGQDAIVKRARQQHEIEWTCLVQRTGWSGTFYAGTTYHGLPYGQPYSSGTYVPHNVSFATFKAATQNAGSAFYTRYGSGASTRHPYYSTDCSAFVSYAWALQRITTAGYGTSGNSYASQHGLNVQNLQVGDAINSPSTAGVGHIILITNVYYSGGTVVGVETTEQTPPKTERRYYGSGAGAYGSLASLQNKMNNGPYYILRKYNRDSVTYTHDCATPIDGDFCSACNPSNFIYTQDLPAQNETISGENVDVEGWVLHKAGVTDIKVSFNDRDPVEVDIVTREDVYEAYPNYQATNQGYEGSFSAADFPLGANTYAIVALAGDGEEDTVGKRTFTISGTRKPVASMQVNGHVYELYDNGYSYKEAEKFASDNHGFLMTIESDAEAQIALELMKQGKKDGYWLGATKENDGYVWAKSNLAVEEVEGLNWADNAGNDSSVYAAQDGKLYTCDGDIGFGIGFIVERYDRHPAASVLYNGYVYSLYDEPLSQEDAKTITSSFHASLVPEDSTLSHLAEILVSQGKMQNYWLENGKTVDKNGVVAADASGINTGFITRVSANVSAANTATNGNSTYWRVDTVCSWFDAKIIAESLGGTLAIFNSVSEQETMKGLISGGACSEYWIGASDHFAEGRLIWLDGTDFTATHSNFSWHTGEPNDYQKNEDFMHVYRDLNAAMNDASIQNNTADIAKELTAGFIIEFSENPVPENVYVFKDMIYAQYAGGGAWIAAAERAGKTGGQLPKLTTKSERLKINKMVGDSVWLHEDDFYKEEYPILSGTVEALQKGQSYANYTIAYPMDFKVLDTVQVGNKRFVLYDGGVPHPIAQAFCEALGGNLASIKTQNELSAIQTAMQSLSKNGYFISEDSALSWNVQSTVAKNVTYPLIKADGTAVKTFYNTENIQNYGFICELEAEEVLFATDSYIEEGELSFTAAYRISSSLKESADATVIAALYDNEGRLQSIKREPGFLSSGGVLAGEITATFDADTKEMQLMVFDSISGLMPLTEAIIPTLSDYTTEPLPGAGSYTLRNVATGEYLTVSAYADTEGLALTTSAWDHAMFQTFNVTKIGGGYRFTPYSASFGTGRSMSGTQGTPTLTAQGTEYALSWDNGYIRICDSTGAYALTDNGSLGFAAKSDSDNQRWMMSKAETPVTRNATTTGGLFVRSGAGTEHGTLGSFASGASVTTMGDPANTKWYCVYGPTTDGVYVYGFSSATYLAFN